ncbi:hypothetical protein D1872_237980 [compost metagenome]
MTDSSYSSKGVVYGIMSFIDDSYNYIYRDEYTLVVEASIFTGSDFRLNDLGE